MKSLRPHLLAFTIFVAAFCMPAGATLDAACKPIEKMVSVQTNWGPREALRQERMMRKALDSVKAGIPGTRDVFILSAALGGEHVFDKEANGAADALVRRYGGDQRKIVLSNAAAALGESTPAATPEHFSTALARIGEAMNPEDVFFLFITSHGARDKGALIYEQERLQSLMSPERLSAELDDAQIKNRVLIVSACFSGFYIPALANPDTAILTAASADRSSFGCQPEREWTYFGDALFAHAMAGGAPLLEAFNEAKVLITKWEADLKVAPSLPSAEVGANAKVFLAELERRRGGKAGGNP
jgi:hypothetical protein